MRKMRRMRKMLMLLTFAALWDNTCAMDSGGAAPGQEWLWSLVSAGALIGLVVFTLTCLCCKKTGTRTGTRTRTRTGFTEFHNVQDGEDFHAHMAPDGPDVYILPLTQVSLPVARQPAPPVQLQNSSNLSRHNLVYLKEIGNGWFGKNLRSSQVVVKELKASASVKEQMYFLEEIQAYRVLQHSSLLQCLAQCTEVTPYLLLMEFCPLGDVKGYLRSSRSAESAAPEPLLLQRMACDIASGLLHLHKHNFTHRDLALRNCLLTADATVKIGDYGLSHTKYRDDYFVTSNQTFVPLRWIAPELVDEVHGNLLVAEQTQQSNIWSLGVTIWELLELGNQPYSHYSDQQVLAYALREQQLRLSKPMLKVPLAERWYEVMQFCWLPPDQRPIAEEVHLLLSYLCAKGASEAKDDFERRWNSMRPSAGHNIRSGSPMMTREQPLSTSSSFPLLERFSGTDGYHSESGDDILTITETSNGLNFEYRWEQAREEQSYGGQNSSSALSQVSHHEAFYPPVGIVGGCLNHEASPPCYQPKLLHAPGVLPVFSGHSPSVNSEYYIRIEEPVDCNMEPEYTMCSYSPDCQGSSGSFLTGSADSDEMMVCPTQAKNLDPFWLADMQKADVYDSNESSPAISLTMEPLLGQVADSSPLRPWESSHYVSYKDRDGGYYYEHTSPVDIEHYLMGGEMSTEHLHESWGSRSLRQALGELETPVGITPSFSSPLEEAYSDSYLDTTQTSILDKTVTGGYYDMMGSLRKTMPSHSRHNSHSVSINVETEGALFIGRRESHSEEEEEEDIFIERYTCNTWPSKHCHRNVVHPRRASQSCRQDTFVDFQYTMPSTDIEDSWPEERNLAFHSLPKSVNYLEQHPAKDSSCLSRHRATATLEGCEAFVYLCHQSETQGAPTRDCCHSHFVDPLTGLLVRGSNYCYAPNDYISDKVIDISSNEEMINLSPAPGGPTVSKAALIRPEGGGEIYVDLRTHVAPCEETKKALLVTRDQDMIQTSPPPAGNTHIMVVLTDPPSEKSQTGDSGLDRGCSSVSLTDILDCSDNEDDEMTDDITDITSGIFADDASPAFKSLQKQVGTPDSMEAVEVPSSDGLCEGSSPVSRPSCSPKAMDSGYDTENNESPEIVPKEPHEPRDQATTQLASMEEDEAQEISPEEEASFDDSQSRDHTLLALSLETPHSDSAYFSDYENEHQSKNEGEQVHYKEEEKTEDTETNHGSRHREHSCPAQSGTFESADRDCDDLLDSSGGLEEWPSQEENLSLGDWAAEVVGAMEEALDALNGQPDEKEEEEEEGEQFCQLPAKTPGMEVLHILPKDEVALQHAANTRRLSSSSPPPPSLVDGEEAVKEDDDSDDSDEMDEELKTYSVQEEESEDESYVVPVVVSDDSHALKLRGLLKTQTLFNLHEELERKKRTVSFFDDVTVYLFDQESPTKELAAHGLPSATEGLGKDPERVSDDSSDGNVSEESAGLEWEDDFPLLPLPTSSAPLDSPPHSSPAKAPETQPAVKFSRFTVSRFSITHVSDSDVDSAGGEGVGPTQKSVTTSTDFVLTGSSEDGDKE
ncbi:serine/threonine-protein kinase LMTK1 isoform X2 [Nerophis ophidion]|uniref:serine/threonine-protein kinase LMTK1 isoform X2 n=1 Tax=Nerophis ophidion TaxID=159077 RepID=UPI002ADFA6EB|nr:serine/threonine-protein kinase LMTK1 isoform X2 [Nerophis ophidion]